MDYLDNIENEEAHEEFVIDDDMKADWAFEKIAKNDAFIAEQQKKHDEIIAKKIKDTDDWLERVTRKQQNSTDYLKYKLNEYRLTLPSGKVDVPSGRVTTRHTDKPIYDDEVLAEYLHANAPEMLKYKNAPEMLKYKPDKSKFKKTVKNVDGKAVDENGQIVEGMHFEPVDTVLYHVNENRG